MNYDPAWEQDDADMEAEAEFAEELFPSCQSCKRFLIPGAIYSNNYMDTTTLCNRCIAARNHVLELELQEANREAED